MMTPKADDLWLKALAGWPEDPRPLAELLRGAAPMSPRVRNVLANLVEPPPGPPINPFVLVAKHNSKWGRRQSELAATWLYREKREAGLSSEGAAAEALKAAGKNVTPRQIAKYRAKHRAQYRRRPGAAN
jgi:hypothetical protein